MSTEFNGVAAAVKGPSVGTFADVLHDDVVDEMVLEVVIGELADPPQRFDLAPVARSAVDAQGAAARVPRCRRSRPVVTLPLISKSPLLNRSGIGSAGKKATFS
ncbi:hypothetical protein KJK32_45020 [Streptomyces sp. JCM17656]|nr:hypothetical protein KJK32_45020 [Streptomyces sp. JCM17656]